MKEGVGQNQQIENISKLSKFTQIFQEFCDIFQKVASFS